jgi:VNT family MFS transporter (synaptic vesicle glycoprotein 2)
MVTRASIPDRTIDVFLGQLYREYKLRLPFNSNGGGPRSVWWVRHYFPLPLLSLCIANSSDATEILMLSYLLANSTFRRDMFSEEFDVDNTDDPSSVKQAEYLAASIFFGMLIGGTFLGFLSDHIGRRPALLAGLVINATTGLFSSFPFLTPTIAQLTAWRFFAGIGIGATVPSLFSLTSEWCPKEVRGAVVTFVASFWMVGSLFVSGMGWLLFRRDLHYDGEDMNVVPAWRIFAALCAMPSAIGAFMVYNYVPESPRFLASTRKKYDTSACVVSCVIDSKDAYYSLLS